MRFSYAAVFSGLVAIVAAQDNVPFDPIYTPANGQEVPAGSTVDITWDPQPAKYGDYTVLITLIGGETQGTQMPLYTIASGIPNSPGSFTWKVQSGEFGKPFYGIKISLENDPTTYQYSNPFKVVAPVDTTTTATATTVATTTTTSDKASATTSDVPTVSVSLSSASSTVTTTATTESVEAVSSSSSSSVVVSSASAETVDITTTTTECPETTASSVSAEAVVPTSTHGYIPVPGNNSSVATTAISKPYSTLSQASTIQTDSAPTVVPTLTPIATGGAVANSLSMALVGGAALLVFAF